MHQYTKLVVWEKSVNVACSVYQLSKTFPGIEKFGLISQMTRAAVSISTNIAEGSGRNSKKEFIQFLSIANGSVCELETQLLISNKLNYCPNRSIPEDKFGIVFNKEYAVLSNKKPTAIIKLLIPNT